MEVENNSRLTTNVLAIVPSTNMVIVVEGKSNDETIDQDGNNNQMPKEVSYINGLHIFSVVAFCILLSSPVILIPQHDAIQFHEYWYEVLFTFALTYPIQWTLLAMLDNHFLLKITKLKSLKVCLILALSSALGFTMIYCSLFLLWTFKLDYNFPMPYGNFISLIFPLFSFLMTLWYLFPKEMRTEKNSRKN